MPNITTNVLMELPARSPPPTRLCRHRRGADPQPPGAQGPGVPSPSPAPASSQGLVFAVHRADGAHPLGKNRRWNLGLQHHGCRRYRPAFPAVRGEHQQRGGSRAASPEGHPGAPKPWVAASSTAEAPIFFADSYGMPKSFLHPFIPVRGFQGCRVRHYGSGPCFFQAPHVIATSSNLSSKVKNAPYWLN